METENKKILSIIIPTYNAAKFLDKGLSSFIIDDNSLLNMLDIIVVNDGSTDNSVEIAQKYVNKYQGLNSRLDEIQASVLDVKLKYIDADNDKRRMIAEQYVAGIKNDKIILPILPSQSKEHVYHLFVVRTTKRDKLQKYLTENGVQTLIHYPTPPHKQRAYKYYNHLSFPITEKIHEEVLSLPISPVMEENEVTKIINCINLFK